MADGQETYIIRTRLDNKGIQDAKKDLNDLKNLAVSSGGSVDKAFQIIDEKVDKNTKLLKRLESEYKNLQTSASAALAKSTKEGDKEYRSINSRMAVIRKEIVARKQVMQEANVQGAEYKKAADALDKEAEAARKASEKQVTLRTAIQQTKQEMANLENQGKRNTSEYQEQQQKLGQLALQMKGLTNQQKVLGSATATYQGVTSALNGVAGAMSVAQGSMGLLVGENEDLQKVMLNVQSVMSITMGMQQVETMLNKNSAFQLVIVANAKKTLAAISAAYNASLAASAAAAGVESTANLGLTASLRAVGAAMKAIPFVGWAMAAAGAAVSVYELVKSLGSAKKSNEQLAKEAAEAKKALEMQREEAKAFANSSKTLTGSFKTLQIAWNALKTEQQKNKFIKDNQEAFHQLGLSVNNINDAYNVLVKNAPAVIKALEAEAKAEAYKELYIDAYQKKIEQWDNRTKSKSTGDYYTQNKAWDTIDKNEAKKAGVKTNIKGQLLPNKGNVAKWNAYQDSQADKLRTNLEKGYTDVIGKYQEGLEAAESEALAAQNALNNLGIKSYDGNTKDKKDKSVKDKAYEQRVKDAEYNAGIAKQARDNAFEVRQAAIDGENEGFDKQMKQIQLNYEKELAAIEDQQKEMVKAAQEREYEKWKLDKSNLGKKFTPTAGLTAEQDAQLGSKENAAWNEKNTAERKARKEAEDALNEYYIAYGDYTQRLAALNRKFAEQIENAPNEGAKNTAIAQWKEDIEKLKQLFGISVQSMADLFADGSKKSIAELDKLIDKYKMLIDYMQGNKGVSRDDLIKAGFSESELNDVLNKINTGQIKISDVSKSLKERQGELGSKSQLDAWKNDFEEIQKQFKNAKDIREFGNALSNGNAILSDMAQAMDQWSKDIINIFSLDEEAAEKFQKVMGGIEGSLSISGGISKIMSGDLVGGTTDILKGGSKLATIFGMSNIDAMNKQIAELTASNKDLNNAIVKATESISESAGEDAQDAYKKAVSLARQQETNSSNIMLDEASKWERGSHSINYQLNNSKGFRNLLNSVNSILGTGISTSEGFLSLTAKQIQDIQEADSDLYLQILQAYRDAENEHTGSGIDELINQYVSDYADKFEELDEELYTSLSGMSLDTLKSDWESLLNDMKTSGKDFSDNFKDNLRNAISSSIIKSQYADKLEQLTKDVGKAMDDETMTEAEAANLQERYKQLYSEAMQKVNDAYEAAGLGETTDQSYSSSGVASMSEDTAEELNGRFAALQIAGQSMAQSLQEMQAMNLQSINHLANIEAYTAHLVAMDASLERIANNTDNI